MSDWTPYAGVNTANLMRFRYALKLIRIAKEHGNHAYYDATRCAVAVESDGYWSPPGIDGKHWTENVALWSPMSVWSDWQDIPVSRDKAYFVTTDYVTKGSELMELLGY